MASCSCLTVSDRLFHAPPRPNCQYGWHHGAGGELEWLRTAATSRLSPSSTFVVLIQASCQPWNTPTAVARLDYVTAWWRERSASATSFGPMIGLQEDRTPIGLKVKVVAKMRRRGPAGSVGCVTSLSFCTVKDHMKVTCQSDLHSLVLATVTQ